MQDNITRLQAFNAMRTFLEMYYERTQSDDVASLLGDLQLVAKNATADPAAWHDWIIALERVLSHANQPPYKSKT